jgi:hypothetical protein
VAFAVCGSIVDGMLFIEISLAWLDRVSEVCDPTRLNLFRDSVA